jgi:hypothetical protein
VSGVVALKNPVEQRNSTLGECDRIYLETVESFMLLDGGVCAEHDVRSIVKSVVAKSLQHELIDMDST